MATFEEEMAALEEVVGKLERGDLSLEDSVGLYEEGVRLSRSCKGRLDAAEGRMQVLVEPTEKGALRVAPIDVPSSVGEDGDSGFDDGLGEDDPYLADDEDEEE